MMRTESGFLARFKGVGAYKAVRENSEGAAMTYWLHTREGSYTRLKESEFKRRMKSEYGENRATLLCSAADSVCMKVRPIAGLTPGVYAEGSDARAPLFLVPEFVTMAPPPAADDPPEKFKALAEEWRRSQDPDERRRISDTMQRIFEEVRDAAVCPRMRFEPWRLLDGPERRQFREFPSDDHRKMFRTAGGLLWTSQPYSYDPEEIVGFAHFHRLKVTISPNWSWWNPGRTTLMEWRRQDS